MYVVANPATNGAEGSVVVSEVSPIAIVILGVGEGVLFREVSSVQECPHGEVIHDTVKNPHFLPGYNTRRAHAP